jgi:hypothetical protein
MVFTDDVLYLINQCVDGEGGFLGLDSLHVVDGFNQNTLILELVTLGEHVEGMVNVLIDFLGVAHFFQKTSEHSGPAHPDHLERETRVGGTSALSRTFDNE